MIGARSYKYSGGSNAAERLRKVPNLECNSKYQSGLHIQKSFHLCIFNLLNVIVQSTMDTFRWQIGKKKIKTHSQYYYTIILYIWVKRGVNGCEIRQTFHLCICHLPSVTEQSTRDTFRWQIVQKKVGTKLLPWY